MLKKIVSIIVITALLMLGCGQIVSAQPAEPLSVELNSVSVELDGTLLNVATIFYNGRVYTSLKDIGKYFSSTYYVDDTINVLNIIPSTHPVGANEPSVKVLKQGEDKINAIYNPYIIRSEGLNTYMEGILYEGDTYVPVRFFAETFSKKIDWDKEGRKVILTTPKDEVVGYVNGEAITQTEYNYFYIPNVESVKQSVEGQSQEQIDAAMKDFKQKVFDVLVAKKIHKQKAKEYNITLDENDLSNINGTLSQVVQGNNGINFFRDLINSQGITFQQVVLYFKDGLLSQKMSEAVVKDIGSSEEQVAKYYEEHKSEYTQPETVKAKHILILTQDQEGKPFEPAKKEEAKKKAEEILAKINAGEDFDTLMKENTQDPGLQSNPDGYTFGKGQMVKEFEDSAFSLEIGKVSGIVETTYGYHIIKLLEKTPSKLLSLDEVKDSIKQTLDTQLKDAEFEKLFNKWKEESKVENKVK